MRITKKSILSFIFLMTLILPVSIGVFRVNQALADESLLNSQIGLSEVRGEFGNSFAEEHPTVYIINLIIVALQLLAVIFLGLLVAAGYMYMTAAGNQEKTGKAVGLIKNAVIGVAIILTSWAIARFIIVMINRAARDADTSTYPIIGM